MPIPLAMCSKPGNLKFPRKLYPNDMFEYEVTRLSEDNMGRDATKGTLRRENQN